MFPLEAPCLLVYLPPLGPRIEPHLQIHRDLAIAWLGRRVGADDHPRLTGLVQQLLAVARQAEPHHGRRKVLRFALLEIVAMQRRARLILDRFGDEYDALAPRRERRV